IAFLAAAGNVMSGLVQLSYSGLTRMYSRRSILSVGGVIFDAGMAAQALAATFLQFSGFNLISRVAGSPQHPVGNGLLSEQYPAERRGFAISAHIAGGNVGTVAVPLLGAALIATVGWRPTVGIFGLDACGGRGANRGHLRPAGDRHRRAHVAADGRERSGQGRRPRAGQRSVR